MARPPQGNQDIRAGEVSRRVQKEAVGAEIGVFAGDMSLCLFRRIPALTLYMIDPWRESAPESTYRLSCDPHSQCSQAEHDAFMVEAALKVAPFGAHARIMRRTSTEAAEEIPFTSLDFAFLDAEHTFEAMRQDLRLWHARVKPGGCLCGHDYANHPYDGVKLAVDEFVAGLERPLELGDDFTWFIRL